MLINRLYPGRSGLRRQVRIAPAPGSVRAEVEDDFHNFIVTLNHAAGRIARVETESPRHPWTTCPAAGDFLGQQLAGLPLDDVARLAQPLTHCTHMLDLAIVGAAHADDRQPSCFNMFVSDRAEERRVAELWEGETCLLAWALLGDDVVDGPGAGNSLRKLREWLPDQPFSVQEPARLLRRAIFISSGRGYDYEHVGTAADMPSQSGACFTFQSERAPRAVPILGSKLDFTDTSDGVPVTTRDMAIKEGTE